MKMYSFFAAIIAAALILASCVKETDGSKTKGSGNETYAGMQITLPASAINKAPQTRANGDPVSSNEESIIKTIGVYIVDRSTSVVDSKILSASEFTQNNLVATTSTTVKTLTGDKDIYVIVNPTVDVTNKITASRRNAFTSAVDINESGYTTYTGSPATLSTVTMTGNVINKDMNTVVLEADALKPANIVDVTVDRNVAKVVVKEKTGGITVEGGEASAIMFGMVAKNKWSNIAPALTASLGTPFKTPTANALISSADPYFNNFSTLDLNDATDYIDMVLAATTSDAAKGFYILENQTTKRLKGNTTAARIKLKYTPTTAKNSKIIGDWIPGATEDVYGKPQVGALGGDGTFFVYTGNGGDGSYWSEIAYNKAIAAGTGKLTAADFSKRYDKGIGYYKIYVAESKVAPKEVKRNYYYELTITEIKGPGKPVDDEEEPFQPVEDDTWLGISIKVNPWTYKPSDHIIQ